jgi:hypothetical protein
MTNVWLPTTLLYVGMNLRRQNVICLYVYTGKLGADCSEEKAEEKEGSRNKNH